MRPRLAALALALLIPALASAEPALVRVFEGIARSAPAPDAPILHRFAEGTRVSVSEESTDGWRRVRLPAGGTGWIEEASLRIPAPPEPASTAPAAATPVPAPAPAPAALAAPAPPPDLKARIYVKDLDHLADLVKQDARVHEQAERLANRATAAKVVGWGGFAASMGAILYGANHLSEHTDPSKPDFMQESSGQKWFVGGLVGAGVSLVAALIISPSRGDLLDVINGWNVAHPDEPFTLDRAEVGRRP
jgi:Bacterial SH3 domain